MVLLSVATDSMDCETRFKSRISKGALPEAVANLLAERDFNIIYYNLLQYTIIYYNRLRQQMTFHYTVEAGAEETLSPQRS